MRRPFFIALEETSEDFVPEVAAEPVNEVEAEANTEEIAEDQANIDATSADVSEALEEAEALQEQVEINEAKLEAAPEEDAAASGVEGAVVEEGPVEGVTNAITEEDVIVSEESLRYSMAIFRDSLGLEKNVKLSIENRQYMTRKQRLQVSTEAIKDFVKRLIASIKNMFAKLVAWIKQLWAKLQIKFGNYAKFIDEKIKLVEKMKAEEVDKEVLRDKLAKINMVEVNSLVVSGSFTENIMTSGWFNSLPIDKSAISDASKTVKALTKKSIDEANKKFTDATGSQNLDEGDKLICATGTSGLCLHKAKDDDDKTEIFRKVSIKVDEEIILKTTIEPAKVIEQVKTCAKSVKDNINKSKLFFVVMNKLTDTGLKEIKAKESKGDLDSDEILELKKIKGYYIDAGTFVLSMYMNGIKGYTRALSALVASNKSAKKEKKDA